MLVQNFNHLFSNPASTSIGVERCMLIILKPSGFVMPKFNASIADFSDPESPVIMLQVYPLQQVQLMTQNRSLHVKASHVILTPPCLSSPLIFSPSL